MTESEIILALEQRWITREELASMLGVEDRKVRSFIEQLNAKLISYNKCILSTSRRPGYHIPNPLSEEDIALVNGVMKELKAKAVSIFERRQALDNFIKYAASAKEANRFEQPTLF